MQKRMIDAMRTLPGVTTVGMVDWAALASGGANIDPSLLTTRQTCDPLMSLLVIAVGDIA